MFSNNTTRRNHNTSNNNNNNNTNTNTSVNATSNTNNTNTGVGSTNTSVASTNTTFLCQCESCIEARRRITTDISENIPTTAPNPSSALPSFFDISFNIYMEPIESEEPTSTTIEINPRIYNIIDNFQNQFQDYQDNIRRTLNTISDTMNDYAYNYADYQYYICILLQTLLRTMINNSTHLYSIQTNDTTNYSIPNTSASTEPATTTSTTETTSTATSTTPASRETRSTYGHRVYVPSTTRQNNSLTSSLLNFVIREIENSLNGDSENNTRINISDAYRNANQTSTNASQNFLYNTILGMVNSQTRTNMSSTAVARLTNEQIRIATRILQYTNDYNEQRCPISLDEFIVGENICQIKHCSHIFKNNSLMNWLRTNNHCPVCRYDITTYREPTTPPIPIPTRNHSIPSSISATSSVNTVNTDNTNNNVNPTVAPKPARQSTHIRYDIESEPEPEWLDANIHDSIPFFNTISPPPLSSPESNTQTFTESNTFRESSSPLYNLFSTGINILPLNQSPEETISQMNSFIERSNMRNIFESAFSLSSQHTRESSQRVPDNDVIDVYPEQPDVD